MITIERLMSIGRDNLLEASKTIDLIDLSQLVEWLSVKDDKIRYQSLLILQNRSLYSDDVYPFWDVFRKKLKSENSYQRSIGHILISVNTKWDTENKFEECIDDYLSLLNDIKPITARQSIQSLHSVIPYKSHLHLEIANKMMCINMLDIKDTMRKLILQDILEVLIVIRKHKTTDEIESYIFNALSGQVLDKKAKKQIESMLIANNT